MVKTTGNTLVLVLEGVGRVEAVAALGRGEGTGVDGDFAGVTRGTGVGERVGAEEGDLVIAGIGFV